jgi:hypothetical protein
VVIEFLYVDSSHSQPYTLEAFFMNSEEIRELLEELLRSFRAYYCESSFKDIGSTDENESLKDTANRAQGTLESCSKVSLIGTWICFEMRLLKQRKTSFQNWKDGLLPRYLGDPAVTILWFIPSSQMTSRDAQNNLIL